MRPTGPFYARPVLGSQAEMDRALRAFEGSKRVLDALSAADEDPDQDPDQEESESY